ncbi:hypothetical protein N7535_007688 [Penicillium sp. DV-2018c]|nr:hypothetical protein N7535_007688 [Penicillium sp. DV-2018c]
MSHFDNSMIVIPMTAVSDGDVTTWPDSSYTQRDDYSWRLMLAENWLKDAGTCEKGVTYIIEKLPDGYCLFEQPRLKAPLRRDTYLFGHPSGNYFKSRVAFLPHFLALIKGTLDSCPCKPCATYKKMKEKGSVPNQMARTGVPPSLGRNHTLTSPRANNNRQPTDAEGPDYWRTYIRKLIDNGEIDEPVERPPNFDLVLTHECLSGYFRTLVLDHAYHPRRGELALWAGDGLGTVDFNRATGQHEILGYDGIWHGEPYWRAGVVTQTPDSDTHPTDTMEAPSHPPGFRVEAIPDPLSNDKSSRKYTYVPLRNIRTFNAWKIFLKDQDRDRLHPSIQNAMTVMSSCSVVGKYHIVGKAGNCSILCKGIFIGSELVAVGDTIRLKPEGFRSFNLNRGKAAKITDVMVITEISLRLTGCVADDPDRVAERCTVLLSGLVYTTDPLRVRKSRTFPDGSGESPTPLTDMEVLGAFRQAGMRGYGNWYRMANGRSCDISPQDAIGRCYDPASAEVLFGTRELGYDLSGVVEGRNHSSEVDTRIPAGSKWLWADCRLDTLGVSKVNGVDCGRPQRDGTGR